MTTKKILIGSLLLFAAAISEVAAQNTYFGTNAGNSNNSGNSGFGVSALQYNQGGNQTAVGHGALTGSSALPVTGQYNVAVGSFSLNVNTSGGSNVAVGQGAMEKNTLGSFNVAVAQKSLSNNITGNSNVALGYGALAANSSGSNNVAIGRNAATYTTDGSDNIFIGASAGNLITSGNGNVFLGSSAVGTQTLNNTMVFAAGSANAPRERFRVDSNGNMGIGTTTPNNKVEIKGDANKSGLRFTNLPNTVAAITNPTTNVLSVDENGDVILVNDREGGTGGSITNALSSSVNTMTSTVNGIAANAPIINSVSNTITGGQLTTTVNGVASTPVTLPSGGSGTDSQTLSIDGYDLTISNGNRVTLPTFTEVDGSVTNEIQTLSQTPLNSATGLKISLSHNGGDVWVDGSETKIQAGTNVTVTGAGTIASPYVINSTATGGGGAGCNIYDCDGAITNATNNLRTVTLGANNLFFNTTGSTLVNGTPSTGRIYIGNSINFPNITTTNRYRLLVEGGILTEKVKVALRSTANWADYVFANDYKLMPLNEVEAFVKENKHLPGVASAENLTKEGLDLAEMQAKQMEKIEELTLYAIEKNKKIEKQEKEIEELKAMVKTLMNKK